MRRHSLLAVTVLALFLAPTATASMITLSDYSNGATPASALDATCSWRTAGHTMMLDVTNNTAAAEHFDMKEVYFNVLDSSNVTGLWLISPPAWELKFNKHVDSFGRWDVRLKARDDSQEITPGETVTFTFAVLGTMPFFDTDFSTELSRVSEDETPACVAAKFEDSRCHDTYGASLPEPGTFWALATATLLLLRRR